MSNTVEQQKIDPEIAEQAAEWVLLLDEASPQEQQQRQQDFAAWQQADPRHAQAAKRVQGFIGQVSGFKEAGEQQAKGARKALDAGLQQAATRRRKKVVGTLLGVFLIVALPALLTLQNYPLRYPGADMYAPAGQWQSHNLADGSYLTLAGKGALELDFNHQQRIVTLLSGEIYVDVAPDPARPFIVKTDYGNIQALGTRFIVNHSDKQKTRLRMLESKVQISAAKAIHRDHELSADKSTRVLQAGDQISLDANGLGQVSRIDAALHESSWQNHQLLVQGWSLAEVLTELKRYHPGFIHFNADNLETIQVSAVLPLDKPQQALRLLAEKFSFLRVQQFTPWLVVVKRLE